MPMSWFQCFFFVCSFVYHMVVPWGYPCLNQTDGIIRIAEYFHLRRIQQYSEATLYWR